MLNLPMTAFSIKGENGSIQLIINEIDGFPHTTFYTGGYEVSGVCIINAGHQTYYSKSELYYSTGELYSFYEQLKTCQEKLSGTAKFVNFENNLELECSYCDNSGHVKITGKFIANPSLHNVLEFEILSDQSYINEALTCLKKIVDIFGNDKGATL
jgi:hypothetical protein